MLGIVRRRGLGAGPITLASFGGAYGESQKKAYAVPFEAATGTHVNMTEYNGGLGEIRAQVESGDVGWDVVDVEMQDAVRGCDDGLFESLKDLRAPRGGATARRPPTTSCRERSPIAASARSCGRRSLRCATTSFPAASRPR